jgi:hypothetical protein
LCSAVKNKGWSGIRVDVNFTRDTSLLEGFYRQGMDGSELTGDELGWQLQGKQFRLAVITSQLPRKEREAHVAERYSNWFDFTRGRTKSAPVCLSRSCLKGRT